MGRNIPSNDIKTAPIHPLLSLAISVIWITALVATISSLCGIWSKKSSKSSTKTTATITTAATNAQNSSSSSSKGKSTNSADNHATSATTMNDDEELTTRPLPPPPSAAKLEFGESAMIKKIDESSSLKNYMSKTSTRKLSSSISMKVSMKIKDKASDFKDKASEMKDKASDIKEKASDISHRKMKNDNESLWTKRIILGEKCKLPNEDDNVNEVILSYDDEQGSSDINDNNNGVASSGSYTRAMSRSVSCVSGESVSSLRQEEKLRTDYDGKGKERVQSDEEDDS